MIIQVHATAFIIRRIRSPEYTEPMRRLRSLIPATAIGVLLLTSCAASTPAALDECTQVVADHTGTVQSNAEITDTVKSPVGAFDWKGSYKGGTFACASPDGELLTTAIVFKDDGTVETLVARRS